MKQIRNELRSFKHIKEFDEINNLIQNSDTVENQTIEIHD